MAKNLSNYAINDSVSLVIFQVNNQKFALPLPVVHRVIQIVEFRTLPESPEYVCGIINMHGEIISVLNMRRLFGMPQKEPELSDKLLIVSTSRIKIGLWIDDVNNVIEVRTNDLVSADIFKYGNRNIQGVLRLENGLVLLNDVEKFLSTEEIDKLEKAIMEENSD